MVAIMAKTVETTSFRKSFANSKRFLESCQRLVDSSQNRNLHAASCFWRFNYVCHSL